MKEFICAAAGVVGGFVSSVLGGWDSAIITLVIFMGVDFAMGILTALMGKSKHTESGGISSKQGFIGIAKKFSVILLIVVAVRVDILLGTNYIRDAVCIAFCINELLSILENTSLMGLPYPRALKNAIDILQVKAGRTERENEEKLKKKIEEETENGNSET